MNAPRRAALNQFTGLFDTLIENHRKPAGSFAAYCQAAACIGIAFFLRLLLEGIEPNVPPFTTLYPAVLFASLWGGAGAGVFAVALGGATGWWAFVEPHFTFVPPQTLDKQLAVALYLVASLIIVAGADYCRRLAKSLQDAEELRDLAVKELSHRLKNKVATIQSIIAYQLRGNESTRDSILHRLTALSSTDTLIESAQGQGASLEDIVTIELVPYDVSRVIISGVAVFLPPKLALVFALLFHELATNAAKYGALSIPAGRVSVLWALSDGRLEVEWRETGRPIVAAPTHKGFGTRLLSRALGQFGGTTDLKFVLDGLVCKMTASLEQTTSSLTSASPMPTAARPLLPTHVS